LKENNFFVGEGRKAMLSFFALNIEKLFWETIKDRTIDNKEKIWKEHTFDSAICVINKISENMKDWMNEHE
jgi:hypothetical protein